MLDRGRERLVNDLDVPITPHVLEEKAGLRPAERYSVILSHHHADHILTDFSGVERYHLYVPEDEHKVVSGVLTSYRSRRIGVPAEPYTNTNIYSYAFGLNPLSAIINGSRGNLTSYEVDVKKIGSGVSPLPVLPLDENAIKRISDYIGRVGGADVVLIPGEHVPGSVYPLVATGRGMYLYLEDVRNVHGETWRLLSRIVEAFMKSTGVEPRLSVVVDAVYLSSEKPVMAREQVREAELPILRLERENGGYVIRVNRYIVAANTTGRHVDIVRFVERMVRRDLERICRETGGKGFKHGGTRATIRIVFVNEMMAVTSLVAGLSGEKKWGRLLGEGVQLSQPNPVAALATWKASMVDRRTGRLGRYSYAMRSMMYQLSSGPLELMRKTIEYNCHGTRFEVDITVEVAKISQLGRSSRYDILVIPWGQLVNDIRTLLQRVASMLYRGSGITADKLIPALRACAAADCMGVFGKPGARPSKEAEAFFETLRNILYDVYQHAVLRGAWRRHTRQGPQVPPMISLLAHQAAYGLDALYTAQTPVVSGGPLKIGSGYYNVDEIVAYMLNYILKTLSEFKNESGGERIDWRLKRISAPETHGHMLPEEYEDVLGRTLREIASSVKELYVIPAHTDLGGVANLIRRLGPVLRGTRARLLYPYAEITLTSPYMTRTGEVKEEKRSIYIYPESEESIVVASQPYPYTTPMGEKHGQNNVMLETHLLRLPPDLAKYAVVEQPKPEEIGGYPARLKIEKFIKSG